MVEDAKILHPVLVLVVVAATVWVADFWHCAGFGLYEDDYGRVIHAMGSSWSELWRHLWTVFRTFGAQGRPFHHDLIYLFSYLGNKLGGLQGIYLLGYVIVAVNAVLFYTVLRRVSPRPVFALTGVLAFALFPADTNQAYLTTTFGSQPSLTFFLLASHCYLSGWRIVSYLVILGSLLCYETVFPVFLAVPVLNRKWDKRLVRMLLWHAAVLGAMIVVVAVIRKLTGEGFVSSLDLRTVMTRPFSQMLIGSGVSTALFFYWPVKMLAAVDMELLPFLLPCFAGFAWLLSRVKLSGAGNTLCSAVPLRRWVTQPEVLEFFRHIGKLALTGLLLLALAYPLTFTVSASVTIGRATRVHLAAAIGASVLFACFCSAVLYVAASYRKKWLAATVLAALLAGLAGFGLTVQRDYKLSWQYQRAFWTDVVRLCPDLTDGTVILVPQTQLRETKHIFCWGWVTPYILRQLYHFPAEWKSPPLLYMLLWNWEDRVGAEGDLLKGADLKGWILEDVQNPSFIMLTPAEGGLRREPGPLVVGHRQFPLRESAITGPPPFPTGVLHDYMIKSPDDEPIDYVR